MRTLRNHRVALAGLFLVTAHSGTTAQSPVTKPPAVPPAIELSMTALAADAVVTLAGNRRLTVSEEAVWVVDVASGTVWRIDGKTHLAGQPVTLGHTSCGSVLRAFKAVWAPVCDPPALARLESDLTKPPVVATATIRGAGALASAAESIWMAMPSAGVVARIDPETQRVVAEVPVAGGVGDLVASGDALWVSGQTNAVVTRIHAQTNLIGEVVSVGAGPNTLAAGGGAVWVLSTGAGTVTRIDPATAKIVSTVTLGRPVAGGSIAAGDGGVWISAPGTPLLRIDASSNTVSHVFTGEGGGSLAVGSGAVWVTATPNAIWRLDPKRIEATRRAPQG